MRKNVKSFQKCGHSSFERLVGVRVGVPACINTLAAASMFLESALEWAWQHRSTILSMSLEFVY